MEKTVGVSLLGSSETKYFNYDGDLHVDDFVVINCEFGLSLAVVKNLKKLNELVTDKIVRIADDDDIKSNNLNKKDAVKALKKCRSLVQKNKIDMYVIDAKYSLDRTQLFFRFMADSRVDFRKLAKELANLYKTRIELRQIGVRDKAKGVGGCGQCGQTLCCSRFLKDFDSVSINMAKEQNIALNPNKINGLCGRLLCCLKYENECYKECRKNLPQLGKRINTDQGEGKVVSIDVLKGSYKVDVDNVGILNFEKVEDESN